MKITCPRSALLSAVQTVTPAVATKSTIPAMLCVKLVAAKDTLTIFATNSEDGIGIRYDLPTHGLKVDRPGAAVVPPKRLSEILKESSDADVTLDADPDNWSTTVRLSAGRVTLPGSDPVMFPDVAAISSGPDYHEAATSVIRDLIRKTEFAVVKKEASKSFATTGVLWAVSGDGESGKVTLAATDTKRVAAAGGSAKVYGNPTITQAIIPVKALSLLEANMRDGEMVRVWLMENTASFMTERATITTPLINGRFPPYASVVPKKQDYAIRLNVKEFASRVRLASIVSDSGVDEGTAWAVRFRFSPGKITLASQSMDRGSSEITLPAAFDGDDFSVGMNPSHVQDMANTIGCDTVLMEVSADHRKPPVFRRVVAVGDDGSATTDADYLHLVMPVVESREAKS